MRSVIYEGVLTHARYAPANSFRYPVCFFALDLDELGALDAGSRVFGYNRARPLSLRDGDHMGDPRRPIRENLTAALAERDVELGSARVTMVTNLRVFGYVFNPITYFFCQAEGGGPSHVVAEVGNTFGERHLYVLGPDQLVGDRAAGVRRYGARKALHVSPFFGMDQEYVFEVAAPGSRFFAAIDVIEDDRRALRATLTGRARPFTDRQLLASLVRHPLMSQQVTALIHRQALRLYRKGATVFRKPDFRPGEGSRPAPAASADRLRGVPAAGRNPLAPLAKAAALWSLRHPARGSIELRLPDGTRARHGDLTSGPQVTVTIASKRLYRRLVGRGRLALGESYVAGEWWADDLPGLLEILALGAERARRSPAGAAFTRALELRPRLPRRATRQEARRDIAYHYDLGNDLYRLFLDDTFTYSCAYFEHPDQSLEDAQRAKNRRIIELLGLGPGDRVLEIGCGWGGFAMQAAEEAGARVVGVTLSAEQHALARQRASERGLSDLIDIRLIDYRDVRGEFDAIVSIEMFEAIGDREYGTFFATCDRLLRPDGVIGLQIIAVPDQRFERYRRGNDWIREYVFPGAVIPSLTAIATAMNRSSELVIESSENIGPHYAETLRRWRERFTANRDAAAALGYGEHFARTWEYYLAFCEAAFRTRALQDYQLVLTRPYNERLRRREAARFAPALTDPAPASGSAAMADAVG